MSVEFLDFLKRERDISIKAMHVKWRKSGLKSPFKLMVKKSLSQNWGIKIFLKNLYWFVIKLESKFPLIQD